MKSQNPDFSRLFSSFFKSNSRLFQTFFCTKISVPKIVSAAGLKFLTPSAAVFHGGLFKCFKHFSFKNFARFLPNFNCYKNFLLHLYIEFACPFDLARSCKKMSNPFKLVLLVAFEKECETEQWNCL